MGKHGPCYHCGVTSTPLWRNGPPEKPVLCNACGSRWRTKGTLANYTPLHARAEPHEFEDHRASKVKTISIKKEAKGLKREYDHDAHVTEFGGVPDSYLGLRKVLDEDTSNRSSSGSAISNSESCAQYGSGDASDLTGPSQPIVWDTMVPSRKRTCVTRPKPSPVEKLTKDLYTIWHEQQSSCFSASSEEELLLESDRPMVSVEIGHGSVLIRHPSSIAREEESEASSLSTDNKQQTLNSQLVAFCGLEEAGADLSTLGVDKIEKLTNLGMEQEQLGRDKDLLEKLQIMTYHNSPLCCIDLQDILNVDKFASYLTNEEQQQLLKFLPSIDILEAPDRGSFLISSLGSMFNSLQFKENLLSFQNLLADGLFDNSFSGLKTEDCGILKKFVLCNLTKSKWVEQYENFKDLIGKNIKQTKHARVYNSLATDSSASVKRSQDGLHQKFSGAKAIMNSPRRTIMSSSHDWKELLDKDRSFCSPNGTFLSRSDVGLLSLDSSNFPDESSEQDLLLDIPSNFSFPQAELLPSTSFGAQASASSSSVSPNFVHP